MGISHTPLRSLIAAAAVALTLGVTGCSAATPEAESVPTAAASGSESTTAALEALGLSTEDPIALVEGLEAVPVAERPAGLTAQVMPGEVRIQPDQPGELVVDIPEDQFYLSVAPYRTQTHPCSFHVPTSCLGELQNADAQVTVTDARTGDVIVDRDARTADNGFVGIWLPKDGEFVVELTVDGDTGVQTVRTGAEDPTCITTLQLTEA